MSFLISNESSIGVEF